MRSVFSIRVYRRLSAAGYSKTAYTIVLALYVYMVLAGCRADTSEGLTISVAASVQNAIRELQPEFEQTHPGTRLTFNFGASGSLQQQIEQGAPVDVFLSAAPKPMDQLASKDLLLAGSRRDLLGNQIVLITPAGSPPADFNTLSQAAFKLIALGDPDTVPAGDYGKQVLTALGLWDQVRPKLVLAKDVRQVLTYVETGNADAGIVYSTDARESTKVRVAATAPENTHSPVLYPVAVVKQTKNARSAREFVDFLGGERARTIFTRHGFATVSP